MQGALVSERVAPNARNASRPPSSDGPGGPGQLAGRSEVPPTIDAAERALRAVVLDRRISGPRRSCRGDGFIRHGYTALPTCRRLGGRAD